LSPDISALAEIVEVFQDLQSLGGQVREAAADYKPLFGDENEDIGLGNAYCWNLKAE